LNRKRVFRVSKELWQAGGPVPLEVLLGEVNERASNIGKVRNEVVIEVGKAKKGAYILDFGGGRPFGNSIEFDRVHSELTRFNNHSKIQ